MLWRKKPASPVDYSLCDQTVTIYHWDGKDTYTTTVIEGVFFEHKKTQNVSTGAKFYARIKYKKTDAVCIRLLIIYQ